MHAPSRFFVAFLLIALVSVLMPGQYAFASRLSGMSDTLSTHGVSAAANHSITFRSASGVPASGTIQLSLADATASTGSITVDDVDILIGNSQVSVTSTASGDTWGVTINSTTRVITLTAPSTSNLLAGGSTMIIRIGTNTTSGGTGTHQMTNSATAGNKLVSVIAGPDVGLMGVRVGVLNSSGGTISPTLDVTGTAESSAGTAATPAPAPAPTQTTPTQTPTSPTTTTDSSSGQTTTTTTTTQTPTTTTTQEPTSSQTTTTTTTTQPTSSEPKKEPTPPPPAPTPTPKAPEEQKAEVKTQATPPPPPPEEKPVAQEPIPPPPAEVFIPVTEVAPLPTQATPSDGFITPPPKITLPDVLPPNAVVQNLLAPATQEFFFNPAAPVQVPVQISYAASGGGSPLGDGSMPGRGRRHSSYAYPSKDAESLIVRDSPALIDLPRL